MELRRWVTAAAVCVVGLVGGCAAPRASTIAGPVGASSASSAPSSVTSTAPVAVAPVSSLPVSSSPAVVDGPCSAPVVSRASASALVPAGPSSVQVCEPGGSRPLNGRDRPVILGRVGAGILAELLNRAPAAAATCAAEPDAVLRFSYPDGSQSDRTSTRLNS